MGSLPHVVEDCQGILQLFSDGSIFRSHHIDFNNIFNIPDHEDGSVVWKDRRFDKSHDLSLRLYKPASAAAARAKLPVILFLHGGGFCVGSRTWPNNHSFCLRLSSGLQALVVAADYRLAPEHRLPAAMDDAFTALRWLQIQALSGDRDTWLCDGVDFESVYVFGDSSGGNMAHHLAVRVGSGKEVLGPVRVRGYVLMAPFFGGTVRTKSESEGPPEPLLNTEILDRFWRLSLPVGETADHPFANPFGPASQNLEPLKLEPILVIVGGNELLKDRVEDYAQKLKDMGKKIGYVEFGGKTHGFFTNEPYCDVAERVLQVIKNFLAESSN